jgi:simple sugar transport system ATP-binding protein
VDIGAATSIRQKLLNLSQNEKAVILISQDLEEIFELSDQICVINNGTLSKIMPVDKVTAADVGLLMGGKLDTDSELEIIK